MPLPFRRLRRRARPRRAAMAAAVRPRLSCETRPTSAESEADLDRLYTPWRFDYIKGASGEKTGTSPSCVFCSLPARGDDEASFILKRASRNFVILNIYP